jgi:hypothetical protein
MSRVGYALCGLAFALVACSSDGDGSGTHPSGALSACLERPGELPRPPSPKAKLPCELVPPGLSLE